MSRNVCCPLSVLLCLIFTAFYLSSCSVLRPGTSPHQAKGTESISSNDAFRDKIEIELPSPDSERNYYFLRGDIAYNNREFSEALGFYSKVSENNLSSAPLLRERLVELNVRSGDLKAAYTQLNKIITSLGEKPETLLLRAFLSVGMGSYQDALRDFAILRQQHKIDSEEITVMVSSIYLQLGKYQEAIKELDSLLQSNPNSFFGQLFHGKAKSLLADYKGAQISFEKALSLRPVPSSVLAEYAEVLKKLGETVKAETILKSIRDAKGDSPATRTSKESPFHLGGVEEAPSSNVSSEDSVNKQNSDASSDLSKEDLLNGESLPLPLEAMLFLAASKLEGRDFMGAEAALMIILAAHPENSRARYYLASSFVALHELDDAVDELFKIKQGEAFYVDSRTFAAYLLQGTKNFSRATAAIEELLDYRPNDARLLNLLSAIHHKAGNLQKAAEVMERTIQIMPPSDRLYFSLAVVYDELKDKDKAIEAMKKAIEINPTNANALNYLGYTYADLGINLEESLSLIQKAISLDADNAYYIDSLAWAYFKLDRLDDALREIDRAVKLAPNDAVLLEHLGVILLKLGRIDEAREAFSRGIENAPDSDDQDVEERIRSNLESL